MYVDGGSSSSQKMPENRKTISQLQLQLRPLAMNTKATPGPRSGRACRVHVLALAVATLLSACARQEPEGVGAGPLTVQARTDGPWSDYQGKAATAATLAALDAVEENLPMGDFLDGSMMSDHRNDLLVAPLPANLGAVNAADMSFLDDTRPGSINPSIYSVMKERFADSGLYRIAEGMYQIRGDLAHITLLRGNSGWIVLDAGMTRDFSAAAWAFARQHLPGGDSVPVSAVIYSHSHIDHFGGVKGFISQADVDAGRTEVIAPYGFMAEALAENVIAGSAMQRRAQYHFGTSLELKPDGSELFYLQFMPGDYTLIAPTKELPEGRGKVTEWDVDGVTIQFMDISQAEAPAATIMYLPKYKMLFNSELMYRGLHNIYTLRGAQVRDALGWSKLINQVIEQWGSEVEIMTGPHGPNFSGNARIVEYMKLQRDNYGFIHNQTLRLINSGMKIQDVGQAIEGMVPESLSKVWHTHGYHGTYSHNARGVVNRYIGFYDGNPANLNPLQIEPEAAKYVEYMGGAESILQKAQADFNAGNYRFVATVVNKLVTAQPDNWEARHLLADAFEQLGYQAEGPQWRNAYLTAAKELRTGKIAIPEQASTVDLLGAATIENLLDSVAVRIDGREAEGESLTLNLVIPDRGETWFVELSNSNLSYVLVDETKSADTTLTVDMSDLLRLMTGNMPVTEIISLGASSIDGSPFTLVTLIGLLEKSNAAYDMVPMPVN